MLKKVMILTIVLSIGPIVHANGIEGFGLQEHDFGLLFEAYSFKYEEPGLMKETGLMVGVAGEYTYRGWLENPQQDLKAMLRGEARYAGGSVDYNGAYQDGTPLQYGGINDRTFEIRGMAGLDAFICDNKLLATLYTGAGYRQLDDELSEMLGGYDRRSQYLYIPVGCEFVFRSYGKWLMTLTAEYDWFIKGQQTSELGRFRGLRDVENDQDHGSGFRASLRLDHENERFFIEPYFRLWNIGKSEVEHAGSGFYVLEPKNRTQEIGVNLGMAF